MLRRTAQPTLFPYTTLFRSRFIRRPRDGVACLRFAHVEGVEANPDHFRRADRRRGVLVDLYQLRERRDLHPRLAAVVVADVVAGRLMAQNQRVGTTTVQ